VAGAVREVAPQMVSNRMMVQDLRHARLACVSFRSHLRLCGTFVLHARLQGNGLNMPSSFWNLSTIWTSSNSGECEGGVGEGGGGGILSVTSIKLRKYLCPSLAVLISALYRMR